MDYASSYAAGSSQLGHHSMQPPFAGGADVVLPPPRPQRMHWSTLLFVCGMAVCALGLLVTIAGVPGKLGYDVDGAPNRNKPSSSDPLQMSKSLDGNMKWLDVNSGAGEGGYVGYVKSVNRSEAAIPIMVGAIASMDAALESIDSGLAEVGRTTTSMKEHMARMETVSEQSAAAMNSLGGDIGFLSSSMVDLAASTEELTKRMAAIEKQAGNIAANGTSAALKSTKELNAALPDSVPVPTTDDGRPLDQVMAANAAARGGGAGTAASPELNAYETGDAL
jgi:hypothetical protein